MLSKDYVLFLIFLFVLLSVNENISSPKRTSKTSSIVSMCFTLPSRIECLPPGIISNYLCRPEHEGTSIDQKIFSLTLLDFGPR